MTFEATISSSPTLRVSFTFEATSAGFIAAGFIAAG
jgi:hypothetical protein